MSAAQVGLMTHPLKHPRGPSEPGEACRPCMCSPTGTPDSGPRSSASAQACASARETVQKIVLKIADKVLRLCDPHQCGRLRLSGSLDEADRPVAEEGIVIGRVVAVDDDEVKTAAKQPVIKPDNSQSWLKLVPGIFCASCARQNLSSSTATTLSFGVALSKK